ncbi:YpeB-like protein with putative protease inhibitory function [Dongia mobilis]|uniref:YpeB-like protein with putative protease inhibitory function n=1 Tax=Dongia mobilis TaxID=578943 RepID=A0A4R6WMW9_9PROT|nr:PepSY domain-containing protein [Dongia mobilis]TDQ82352.1 YpeB-like protein with putative protease inhibitory function [Dongia mobilis]
MPSITAAKFAFILTLTAPLALSAGPAGADDDWERDDCRVTAGAQRIDSSRAIQIAEGLGYQVTEFEIDDGCIELEGRDRHGAKMKLRLDPVSGDIIPYRR